MRRGAQHFAAPIMLPREPLWQAPRSPLARYRPGAECDRAKASNLRQLLGSCGNRPTTAPAAADANDRKPTCSGIAHSITLLHSKIDVGISTLSASAVLRFTASSKFCRLLN